MRRVYIGFIVASLLFSILTSAETLVVNPSFEKGNNAPDGWTLDGTGAWTNGASDGVRAVAVSGNGEDMSVWKTGAIAFEPLTAYRLRFSARVLSGAGGCLVTGPAFCNRDITGTTGAWEHVSSIFVTADTIEPDKAYLKFGHWHWNGTAAFDRISLERVVPIYKKISDITLGEGESISGTAYKFLAPHDTESRNHSRPLTAYRGYFNTQRWVLGDGGYVTYRHRVGDRMQREAKVSATINWYKSGELIVEAGIDGISWREIARRAEKGEVAAAVPSDLLPAKDVWIRLRTQSTAKVGGTGDPGSLQVQIYTFSSVLDGVPLTAKGMTRFFGIRAMHPDLGITINDAGDMLPGGNNILTATIVNKGKSPITVTPCVTVTQRSVVSVTNAPAALPIGETVVRARYAIPGSGPAALTFALDGKPASILETEFYIPDLYSASYGETLTNTANGTVAVWWAQSGWRISEERPAPAARGAALVIRAAKNEADAAQIVIRPAKDLRGLTAVMCDLKGAKGVISPEHVDILAVRCVPVEIPTDTVGCAGNWPDPLMPITAPMNIAAGRNQPLWIRVRVPKTAAAGEYRGVLTLSAPGFSYNAPVIVTVYDFEFPDKVTCESAFGLGANRALTYHRLTNDAQKRIVYEKYLSNFSAHHISPYDPAALDPIKVTWKTAGGPRWEGGSFDTNEKHSGTSALVLRDEKNDANVSAKYSENIPIPDGGVKLRFRYKTDRPAHQFLVTFNHLDAGGKWMSGKNNDIKIEGSGEWRMFEQTISKFPAGAAAFKFNLMATLWSEKGTNTGTVWFDDISLTDVSTRDLLAPEASRCEMPTNHAAPEPVIDWSAWDAAMERAFSVHNFSSMRFPLQGLGGGTFFSRNEPSIAGFTEGTPQYAEAFKKYAGMVEQHLKEKGWLDKAYIYWFDEPDPKDYPFVMNGFNKIKENAPGLRRMLTEQVEDGLIGGPNLWCPVSSSYNHEAAEKQRAAGDHFWWYVCCSPKAPYATEFIDHPATDLRVWLWQTWQNKIEGVLVWESVYWTSDAAYPDRTKPQNPYLDPMAWVSGYDAKPGDKRPWGNGDGRFVYPPEAFFNSDGPVLDGPVDSIRWEMLRDGIEDYEYFVMLKRLIAEKGAKLSASERMRYEQLLVVPESISRSLTEFTTDPAPIEARRHELAKAIETLSR
ncbi:MAG: DUF4091 domain-containing protein [Spirochaetes bacterium]|nr:DUF4091 domain-containing protein [Spirochaetota bacterium]